MRTRFGGSRANKPSLFGGSGKKPRTDWRAQVKTAPVAPGRW